LEFEPDRCGDSISISQHMPRSASQRGSKVWGTVCCKVAFSPNTGKVYQLVLLCLASLPFLMKHIFYSWFNSLCQCRERNT